MRKVLSALCLTLGALFGTAVPLASQFPGEVEGRVVDARTGAPIEGARVELSGDGRAVRSAADGSFLLRPVPAGRWMVEVSAHGYHPHAESIAAEDGRRANVSLALHPAPVALGGVAVYGERRDATARIIERDAIEESRARDLGELLEGGAGVVIQRRGGAGAATEISIRGSAPDQVLVLVDGVPINSPLTGRADLSTIPLAAVRRVTVLPGARTAEHGPGALAGAVVVETGGSGRGGIMGAIDLGAWGERGGTAELSGARPVGPWRTEAALTLDGRMTEGGFRYAVPEMRGGGETTRLNADLTRGQATGRLLLTRGGLAARIRGTAGRSERGVPGSIVRPSPTARHADSHLGAGLSLEVDAGPVRVEPQFDVQWRDSHFHDPHTPYGGAYDETLNATLTTARVVASLPGGLPLHLGAEHRGAALRTTMLEADAPAVWDSHAFWLGGALGADIMPGWTSEVRGTARIDRISSAREVYLNPRAVLAHFRDEVRLHLSVGSAVSPPSPADLFFQPGAFARPNPDLAPERVRFDAEVGAEVRGGGRIGWTIRAEAYHADVDGMIIWSPDHRFVWSPRNFDVRRRGGALAGALEAGGVTVEGDWSLTAVEYTGQALTGQVIYRPRHSANGRIRVPVLAGSVAVSGRWVGERRTVPASDTGAIPAHWAVDTRVSHPVRMGPIEGDLWIALDDLFDRRAEAIVHHPAPGRAWRLGVRARWGAGE